MDYRWVDKARTVNWTLIVDMRSTVNCFGHQSTEVEEQAAPVIKHVFTVL